MVNNTPDFTPIQKLTKDLKSASITLSDHEARFLVDCYYIMQEDRKRSYNQERSLQANAEPSTVISWLANQSADLEKQIQKALDIYTSSHPMGAWMRSVVGIGPVISAGFLAHIDITKAPTVGHIWQYAGIAGTGQTPWEKGKKRPFNAGLKVICWKAGQSFLKLSNNEKCFYGKLYRERKENEVTRNNAGEFKVQADERVNKVGKTTEAYKSYVTGKLPPAHIDARARRFAVKHFLSDLHAVWYFVRYGTIAPKPWVIEHGGHVHFRLPHNADLIPGLVEAYKAAGPVV